MLKCNGKTFMNLQEAVQWLLNNNALFFMCNEDYAADTEISLSELVNPSPANPKIGSLVLFADGKISPITGITDDSFTVGSDYTDIRLVKSVTHFSIDADQHLIVHYTDGTSDDLGAIFSGDINIDGNLTAKNIVEVMEGYSFAAGSSTEYITQTPVYAGVVKNGNKLTFVVSVKIKRTQTGGTSNPYIGFFAIPREVGLKLRSTLVGSFNFLDNKVVQGFVTESSYVQVPAWVEKASDTLVRFEINIANVVLNTEYFVRQEVTFLLSDNMAI